MSEPVKKCCTLCGCVERRPYALTPTETKIECSECGCWLKCEGGCECEASILTRGHALCYQCAWSNYGETEEVKAAVVSNASLWFSPHYPTREAAQKAAREAIEMAARIHLMLEKEAAK